MMKKSFFFILSLSFVLFYSCSEDKTYTPAEEPANPFDTVDYGSPIPVIPIDSNSFLGIHEFIFTPSCAVPGCHDGHFEPDFRTVQSAYNTLVYQPVLKDYTPQFDHRVKPGDPVNSWLYERLVTNDEVLGRMPLYDTLSDREVQIIKNWIEEGAKDVYGNSPMIPSKTPSFFGILAFENDTNGMRLDTTRQSITDPIELPENMTVDIWLGLIDHDDNGEYKPAYNLTYNKYKISNHLYEFDDKNEQNLLVLPLGSHYWGVNPFAPPGSQLLPYYHHFKINTADYPKGQRQYFRIYVQDEKHNAVTELPSDGSPVYFLTIFSFVVL